MWQIDRITKREQKHHKEQNGMRITGRSIRTIEEVQRKRAEKIRDKNKKEEREELENIDS